LSLRQAFADWLPQTWTKQPKRGFEVPLGLWFRDMLYPMARDTLLSSNAIVHTWCRPAAIESLFDEHHAGKDDHSRRLWALLILELWLQHANSLN
jgi:asparagine synthase (glutamine-hydrolysing)